jgi:hypothetical protein
VPPTIEKEMLSRRPSWHIKANKTKHFPNDTGEPSPFLEVSLDPLGFWFFLIGFPAAALKTLAAHIYCRLPSSAVSECIYTFSNKD